MLCVKIWRDGSGIFFQAASLAQQKRPTQRAQMKGEVKDAKKIGNALMGGSEKATTPQYHF